MKSCSLHHWILFFIILNLVYPLSVPSLTAKLHQPATLTCNQKCSGLMTWNIFGSYVVARCDQFSCSSEEGFEISHDQYLKGNLDLVIRSVDYSKRTIFTCYCGNTPICDILLIIESVTSQVQKKSGEALVLHLLIPDVEVDYNSRHSVLPFSKSICNMTDGSLQCGTDYEQRASLSHTELTLRDLKVSDSGVYIIRDMKRNEIIHTYVLSVEEDQRKHWIIGVVLGVVVVVVLLAVVGKCLILHVQKKKQIQCLVEENKILKDILLDAKEEGEQSKARFNNISKFINLMVEVEELKKQYSNKDQGRFQYWIIPKNATVDDILSKKMAKIDELVDELISERPELNELSELWSRKKTELDSIMKEHGPRERADPEVENQNVVAGNEQNSVRSASVSSVDGRESRGQRDSIVRTNSFSNSSTPKYGQKTQERAEEWEKLNPIGARSEQNQTSPHSGTGGEEYIVGLSELRRSVKRTHAESPLS